MQERRIIAGLDIGTSKVCALLAEERPNGALDIVGMGTSPSRGVKKGLVVDLDATAQAVQESMAAAQRMAGVKVEEAYVSLSGGHIGITRSHGVVAVSGPEQEITEDDVRRVLEAARVVPISSDREIIHVLPMEFIVDGCRGIQDPVEMSGIRLEAQVQLVTGNTTSIQNVVKAVNRAGFEVEGLVLEPLAAAEAVLSPEEREAGCILVDLGAGTTSLAVFCEGYLWHAAIIPLGGGHLTSDLAYGLRISPAEAEMLKLNFSPEGEEGKPIPRRGTAASEIERIITPRVEEIFEFIRQEMVKVPHPTQIPTQVVLTGGGSLLAGIKEVAERVLDLPVQTRGPMVLGGLGDTVKRPQFAVAVGLVLVGREERRRRAPHLGNEGGFWQQFWGWFKEIFPI